MKVLAFPGPKQRLPDEAVEDVAPPPEPSRPSFGADEPPPRYDRVTIRAITVAIVLSLFVHILLFVLPLIKPVDKDMKAPGEEGPLQVSIQSAPPPGPPKPEPPPVSEQPRPTPTPTPPKQVVKPQTPPKSQIAIAKGPRPPFVVPPPVVQQPPTPDVQPQPQPVPRRPASDDFASSVAAAQQQRRNANGGQPDSISETDDERANRIAKANVLAQQRSSSPGQDPDQAGGIFDLRHTGITDAEFVFNGWNDTFQRQNPETHEVRTRPGEDIRLAVIREMIGIIRKRRPDSFEWHSHRLQKVVTMSARIQDQAELETFLMKEFYPQDPRAQGR